MTLSLIRTLWGEEEIAEMNPCIVPDCGQPRDSLGNGRYHKRCSRHHKEKYKMMDWDYKQFRKNYCENTDSRLGFKCTTTIIMDAQLTIDHIDPDGGRIDPANLQTLCACCHAVKTRINGDNISKKHRPNAEQKALRWQKFMESLNTNGVEE